MLLKKILIKDKDVFNFNLSLLFFIISLCCFLSSCKDNSDTNILKNRSKDIYLKPNDAQLEEVHIQLKEQEKREIEAFIERTDYKFIRSKTGLLYDIYQKNDKGAKIERGDAVKISYTIRLLNGNLIESSVESGEKEIIIGSSSCEAGLTELLLNMRRGEHACAIIPSHLAFGLSGDGERIPPRATLVYDIEIKGVFIRTSI